MVQMMMRIIMHLICCHGQIPVIRGRILTSTSLHRGCYGDGVKCADISSHPLSSSSSPANSVHALVVLLLLRCALHSANNNINLRGGEVKTEFIYQEIMINTNCRSECNSGDGDCKEGI